MKNKETIKISKLVKKLVFVNLLNILSVKQNLVNRILFLPYHLTM